MRRPPDPQKLFAVPSFDHVMISYSLSMIPDWRRVLKTAASNLKPGGRLHIVDFGHQERLPGIARALLRRWLAMFDVTPRDDLEPVLVGDRREQRRHLEVRASVPRLRPIRRADVYPGAGERRERMACTCWRRPARGRLGARTEIFRRPDPIWPTVATVVAIALSFALMALALRSLPFGTAYAVWTGIGAVGSIVVGMLIFSEPTDPVRILCLTLIVAGMVGLKLNSPI